MTSKKPKTKKQKAARTCFDRSISREASITISTQEVSELQGGYAKAAFVDLIKLKVEQEIASLDNAAAKRFFSVNDK